MGDAEAALAWWYTHSRFYTSRQGPDNVRVGPVLTANPGGQADVPGSGSHVLHPARESGLASVHLAPADDVSLARTC